MPAAGDRCSGWPTVEMIKEIEIFTIFFQSAHIFSFFLSRNAMPIRCQRRIQNEIAHILITTRTRFHFHNGFHCRFLRPVRERRHVFGWKWSAETCYDVHMRAMQSQMNLAHLSNSEYQPIEVSATELHGSHGGLQRITVKYGIFATPFG